MLSKQYKQELIDFIPTSMTLLPLKAKDVKISEDILLESLIQYIENKLTIEEVNAYQDNNFHVILHIIDIIKKQAGS